MEMVLEGGHLNEGLGTLKARRPKGSEGYPEVREGPNELTLRAGEVGTWKSYINVDHIEKERWGPPLVDYDWYVHRHRRRRLVRAKRCKERSIAVGLKKP